jgi:hypothetical protein
VIDADMAAPTPWLATAYVAGTSLADAVESQGPLPAASVLTLAAGLAEGLQAIHAAGLPGADWLPAALTHVLTQYAPAGIAPSSGDGALSPGPQTVTAAPALRTPPEAATRPELL